MTATQKIIKNIALVFAIFLSISILTGILVGGYKILNILGLINSNKDIITKDLRTISSEVVNVETLKIDLEYTNLYIKKGEEFRVDTNNSKIKFVNRNGRINIKERDINLLDIENIDSNLIVYIPDMMIMDEIVIDAGFGEININGLDTKGLYLELGAGAVYMEDILVDQDIEIDGGIGETKLVNCKLNNLKADLGVGEFKFNGVLTGNSEIDSGVGAIRLDLINKREEYTINASKGLGNIIIDLERIENDIVYGNGSNYLDINGGFGEINVKFID